MPSKITGRSPHRLALLEGEKLCARITLKPHREKATVLRQARRIAHALHLLPGYAGTFQFAKVPRNVLPLLVLVVLLVVLQITLAAVHLICSTAGRSRKVTHVATILHVLPRSAMA